MSLRVWLPLNGNLNNQGTTNSTITNNGASTSSNGKIGSCYSFNGSSSWLLGNNSPLNNSTLDWSFCCWAKFNSSHAGCLYSNRTQTSTAGICVFWYSGQFIFDDGARWQWTPSVTISNNVWYHLTFTRQTGVGKKFYINGVLVDHTPNLGTPTVANSGYFTIGGSQSAAQTISGNWLNGYLNDVRVYDHALSPKEIKEISKALICHYPMDQAFAIDNLVRNYTYSVYNNYASSGSTGTITATGKVYNGCNVYRLTYTPNDTSLSSVQTTLHSHGICGFSRTFLADTKYCFWILYKPISHPDTIAGGTASNIGGFTEIPSKPWGGGWYICGQSRNGSVTTNKTDQIFVSFKTPSATAGTPITIDFCCPHLVLGYDYILPEYDYAGTNNLTIFDTSGYKNNGTKSGTLSSSIDSPKYEASTIFGDSGLIASPAGKALNTSGNFTVAGWFYRTSAGSTYYASRDTYTTSVCLENARYFVYGTNGSAYVGNWTSASDTWQHVVLVHDASTSKLSLYVNGSYISQVSTSGNIYLNNTLDIGGRQGTNQYKGNISDFRIYATALSADDVKELYQTSASITNNGAVISYDFTEG